jgi:hypothetical protein
LEKEWDIILLVLLNEDLEPTKIYEAGRIEISQAIRLLGSKTRSGKGALTINKFKSIGKLLWERN